MPGRQSTGPVATQKKLRPKRQKRERTLNALAIAEKENPQKVRIEQHRLGEVDQGNSKRRRDDSGDDSEEEHGRAQKSKRSRIGEKDKYGNEIEGGSDSEGGEWMTGQVDSDDDSDLDSDEAMGESDDERFEGFTFRGSSSTKPKKRRTVSTERRTSEGILDPEIILDEGNELVDNLEEESDGFAEEAVDLAAMLDASDSQDAENTGTRDEGVSGSDSEVTGSEDEGSSEEEGSVLSVSDADDGTNDADRLSTLQTLVTTLSTGDTKSNRRPIDDAQEAATPSEYGLNARQKLTVADLLPTVTDPRLKKSLKLMVDDGKKSTGKSSGIPQKLEVPLAKRQQDRLDRAAAYEKSKETLNRWIDTVKHNRRAEHLSFPLQDPDAISAKDTSRLQTNADSKPLTSLESTIQNILVESGLAPIGGKSQEAQLQEFEELATNKMPIEEVQARRAELRKARELLFREEIRAKRIKKIKSKSYRRVHRKERERNLLREKEAFEAAGVEASDEEQERVDRRRAEERMGARHREGRWAKGVKDSGRTAWDEDARSGVTEMARRGEELRKRIEGREIRDEEDDPLNSSSGSSEDDEDVIENGDDRIQQRLEGKLRRLDAASGTTGPGSGLSSMKFMQNAEASRKKQNDEDIKRMQRELAGEDSPSQDDTDEVSGRRSYGPQKDHPTPAKKPMIAKNEFEERAASDDEDNNEDARPVDDEIEIIIDNTPAPSKPKKQPSSDLTHKTGAPNLRLSQPTAKPPKKDAPIPGPFDPTAALAALTHRPNRKTRDPDDEVLIFTNPSDSLPAFTDLPSKPAAKPPKHIPSSSNAIHSDSDSDSDSFTGFSPSTPPSPHLTNADLIQRAFAGDDVFETFQAEKAAAVAEDDEKMVETTLPGWGAWTGEGLTKREKKNNAKKKTFEKVEGLPASKRVDRGLDKVLVNEKRIKKVRDVYLVEMVFELLTTSF